MQRFNFGDATEPATFKELTRVTPTRAPTREGDLVVIIGQAAVSTLVVGLATTITTMLLHWPWHIPAVATTAALCISWFYLLADQRSLLRVVERIVGQDLNGDGVVGTGPAGAVARPTAPPELIVSYVEHHDNGGRHMETDRLPITPEELAFIGRKVFAEKRPLSKAICALGRDLFGQPVISETRFRQICDIMREKGYARYKKPNAPGQGHELTKKGLCVVKWYAENWRPPT